MRSGFRPPEVSLRVRLLVLLVVLATVGLAAADVVSYRALHNYLYSRVDQQLESAVVPVSAQLAHKAGLDDFGVLLPGATGPNGGAGAGSGAGTGSGAGAGTGAGAGPELGFGGAGGPAPDSGHLPPGGTFGQLRDAEGKVLSHTSAVFGGEQVALPALPEGLEASAANDISPVTVGQRGGGSEQFRLAEVRMPDGTSTVVAVPLGDTAATLNHLAVIELIVSAAILLALALGGWWLVGVGLRPLRRMGEVAGDIAAGDLSRRVEPANGRTEIGRLGTSLNAMLEQIEAAFAEREASEARLRQFLADASHELRTPLASIRGYSELYRIGAGREPEQVERAMGRIESESERMAGLVDDLLALARIDEMREPARARIDLRALLEDARDDARASSPDRAVTLTVSAAEPGARRSAGTADGAASAVSDPVWIDADSDQLRRVFANLLRNAAVHTPAGSPVEIAVGVGEGTAPGSDGNAARPGTATVRVRDHGPGLPAGDPRAVFERFWRGGSASRGREDGGAGLGLAIVAAVVSAHGGEVEAANAPDGGAVFTVRLPLAAAVPGPQPA
jgi:two-component system OmpR family sensor kinase